MILYTNVEDSKRVYIKESKLILLNTRIKERIALN